MINKHKAGIALGTFAALWHLVWSILAGAGWGQTLLTKAMHLHYLNMPFTVANVTLTKVVGLVVGAFVGGYVVAWVFAAIWNWYQD